MLVLQIKSLLNNVKFLHVATEKYVFDFIQWVDILFWWTRVSILKIAINKLHH